MKKTEVKMEIIFIHQWKNFFHKTQGTIRKLNVAAIERAKRKACGIRGCECIKSELGITFYDNYTGVGYSPSDVDRMLA